MKKITVSLYILNYNGERLFAECLPSILESVASSKYEARIFVIDNQSTDQSVEVLRRDYPAAQILISPSNDFLCSFNSFVAKDDAEIVVLMNNDIKVEPSFLDPLVDCLTSHADVSFASSLCYTFDKKGYEGGVSDLVYKWGWWGTESKDSVIVRNPEKQLFTVSIGACIAIKTQAFNELGGYDPLYLPGTLEDLDLCYRSWRQGGRGYYVPESVIYHKGQASFKPKFGEYKIRRLATRNTMLFIWKNIHDPLLFVKHLFCLPLRLIASCLKGDFAFVSGVFAAIIRLPKALAGKAKSQTKVNDRELIHFFKEQSVYLSEKE